MRFKTHSMQDSNKEMLDKALVIQTQDPTIATLDSIIVMPFDYRIVGKLALSFANAFTIKLKSYDKDSILASKAIPQASTKAPIELAMIQAGSDTISNVKAILYKSSLYDEKSGKQLL